MDRMGGGIRPHILGSRGALHTSATGYWGLTLLMAIFPLITVAGLQYPAPSAGNDYFEMSLAELVAVNIDPAAARVQLSLAISPTAITVISLDYEF